jgi:5,10-methenyltetrahydrofolate synthetase
MTLNLAKECLEAYDIWYKNNTKNNDKSYRYEYTIISEILSDYDNFNLNGGVIKARPKTDENLDGDGEIVAWTVSEQITQNCALIHFEKANLNVHGAFVAINKLHLQHQYPNLQWVNREDDAGVAGLRKAKLSYHPTLLPKCQGLSYNKIAEYKKSLRDKILQERGENTEINLNVDIQKIMNHPKILTSNDIFCYVSMPSEIDTNALIAQLLANGKRIYVPYINEDADDKNEMLAIRIENLNELVKTKKGFMQPIVAHNETLQPPIIDVAIVPAVACDELNNRLGYGGGYYDRFFEKYAKMAIENNREDIYKIALVREDCKVNFVPTDDYDIKMDEIM